MGTDMERIFIQRIGYVKVVIRTLLILSVDIPTTRQRMKPNEFERNICQKIQIMNKI